MVIPMSPTCQIEECAHQPCIFSIGEKRTLEDSIKHIQNVRFCGCLHDAERIYYSMFPEKWTGGRVKHEIDEVF